LFDISVVNFFDFLKGEKSNMLELTEIIADLKKRIERLGNCL